MAPSTNHFRRGNALHRSGKLKAAGSAYARHVSLHPADKAGYFNLGVTLQATHDTTAAIQCYSKALDIDPYYPEALNNVGILLHRQGKLDAARACFARALAARPSYADAEYNYATASSDAGDFECALLHFSRVLERNPSRADAWNNLGNVFLAMAQPADALQAFQLATSIDPAVEEGLWNTAVTQLTLGHLPAGWDHFTWRGAPRHVETPQWHPSAVQSKSVLIHSEQGLGDTIQLSRYCSQVACDHIILECHPELVGLFASLKGPHQVLPFGSAMPAVEAQIPLATLPKLFATAVDTIPRRVPYLTADPALVTQWAARFEHVHSLKVGLVWAGNPKHKNDANRSIPPHLLAALAGVPNVTLYCLQQKPASADVAATEPLRFADVFDDLTFADTAAILMNLDLTISVDTATAHLAGALARPVWTLLPHAPDWRWMMDRVDSPWYPTMRLFRQPKRHDWPSVLSSVAGELSRLASQRTTSE